MSKLILLRHFKSQWNLENRFTGWVDAPLCQEGRGKIGIVAKKIAKFRIDAVYSSPLIRNLESTLKVLEAAHKKYPLFIHLDEGKMKSWGKFKELHKNYLPVYISEALNERYYGSLQGLNKAEMMKKYGKAKVQLWRRSFEIRPPGGESLKDTLKRVTPFYRKYIESDLKKGRNVLVVASHNSLRALIKHIEKIPDEEIINFEVPYAGSIEYNLSKSLKLKDKKKF